MAAWIKTPNDVVVNVNAIAEILPPRALGIEYTVEMVMLNGDPSRQDKRELCLGTKEECEAFKADLESKLEILTPAKTKPATKKSSTKSSTKKTTAKSTKADAEAEAPAEGETSEA